MDIGTGDGSRRWKVLPLFTVRNRVSGETRAMADLGFAMFSGHWADLGKFRVPTLRSLAARAPYSYDGSAAKIEDAVAYHAERFGIELSSAQQKDLVAFLESL